ncbi:Anti-sigma-F factor antagonist RsfA [Mycobacterium simulans]|uniref:Anti-sigma factor antagonist n=1 Tax=Mycobacterium simulans TaxID=627089 RepID=A0A7Z7IPD3_9MYCO|nr:anti-sigma factor antagonist [Mycobacterium simulans]SOJ56378.1 Anti-sigma-F factor antagonist RsfA [Mycobacterium simulans]SON61441.1 Anti-sigma-F factor antagonist RsfA [Mycobacterium simulans]
MNVSSAGSFTTQVVLSARLASELGEPHSTLRAVTQRNGPAVVIRAGGEVDAANERTWQHLIGEAAAIATPPGSLVVDVSGLDFMGCCAFATLAEEAQRCRRRGIELRLVSRDPGLPRIIAACGFTSVLPVHRAMESALSIA